MANYFFINGFFKDDKEKFSGYIVKDTHDIDDNDDDIFYYGLSEKDIIDAIESGWKGEFDFVITSYEPIKEFYVEYDVKFAYIEGRILGGIMEDTNGKIQQEADIWFEEFNQDRQANLFTQDDVKNAYIKGSFLNLLQEADIWVEKFKRDKF